MAKIIPSLTDVQPRNAKGKPYKLADGDARTAMPRCPDFRITAGYFLLCVPFLLSGCGDAYQRPGLLNEPPPDGVLRYAATLPYEDRLMMRRYLLQGLRDGIAAMAMMQARIDIMHDAAYIARRSMHDATPYASAASMPKFPLEIASAYTKAGGAMP